MKKLYLCFLILYAFLTQAQISILNTDMPAVNDTLRVSITSGPANVNQTGANYTWDYTWLYPAKQRVDTFLSLPGPSTTYGFVFNNQFLDPVHQGSYMMPLDSLPMQPPNAQIKNIYGFLKNSSSQFSQVGFGANVNGYDLPIKYDPVDVMYKFPLNYGNTDSSNSAFGVAVPNYGYFGQKKSRQTTVDGWGTLKTPYGTFDVLRIKSDMQIQDTVYNDSTQTGYTVNRLPQTEYKWLAKNKGIPLLLVNVSEIGGAPVVTGIEYRDSVRTTYTGAYYSIPVNEINVYPNPASSYTIVDFRLSEPSSMRFSVYDIHGRTIFSLPKKEYPAGMQLFVIPLDKVSMGVYILEMQSNNGWLVRKLVVAD